MEEIINTKTVPDIPENALPNEPEYTLKKKFNFAAIPSVFMVFSYFLTLFINAATCLRFYYGYKHKEDGIGWYWVTKNDVIIKLIEVLFVAVALVAVLALCVLLFVRVKNFVLGIPLIVCALYPARNVVSYVVSFFSLYKSTKAFGGKPGSVIEMYTDIRTILDISYSVCFALAFILAAVCVFVAASKKTKNKAKKIWFVPVAVYSLGIILSVFYFTADAYYGFISYEYPSMGNAVIALFRNVTFNLITAYIPECITILLLCKWISNPYKKVLKKVPEAEKIEETNEKTEEKTEVEENKKSEPVAEVFVPQMPPEPVAPPQERPIAPPPVRPAPVMNTPHAPVGSTASAQKENIELIKQYKELLDMGAITQEEYDKKKNKLLGD